MSRAAEGWGTANFTGERGNKRRRKRFQDRKEGNSDHFDRGPRRIPPYIHRKQGFVANWTDVEDAWLETRQIATPTCMISRASCAHEQTWQDTKLVKEAVCSS